MLNMLISSEEKQLSIINIHLFSEIFPWMIIDKKFKINPKFQFKQGWIIIFIANLLGVFSHKDNRQQMISHLLDLQGMILRVQQAIFAFHGRDLHESKV